ncbi:DUF5998 family protein [Timonella sp. A28]|uniref:DUF5998 family protein n=1 Tax=Timonella sp. A28 TaxID=3442640 RepID=UPI003EC09CC8
MQLSDQTVALASSLERSGYYPQFVSSVLDIALADEPVIGHLVHVETTFATAEVRRHVTVLALTSTRLVVAHVDDHAGESHTGQAESRAAATTESVALSAIKSVVLTHAVASPEQFVPGQLPVELTLAIGWGAVSRMDLEPAVCPDPNCEADHGYSGALTSDDVMIRISAEAEGNSAVKDALVFARTLSAHTGNKTR